VLGRECLSRVLVDASARQSDPPAAPPRVDRLALAGFGAALLSTLIPWSRFGDSSWLGAWRLQWSLLAALTAAAGVSLAIIRRKRPIPPLLETQAYAVLALLVVAGSFLHLLNPPPLSAATLTPWVAVAAGSTVLVAALLRLASHLLGNERL
jgi:hypothetical protein